MELKNKQVQFIVETQLLLEPYLLGRCKMHLFYKICRADNPGALHSDFRVAANNEVKSFDEVQDDAKSSMKTFAAETSDVNGQHTELKGATRLYKAAEQGHEKAVLEILRHPQADPNKTRDGTQTTPLHIAAHHGHVACVKALLGHPQIQINLGKLDTGASPLIAAAQEGREEVVEMLLQASGVDVNLAVKDGGVSSLCIACDQGHEHVVKLLLGVKEIDIHYKPKDGNTALFSASLQGHETIAKMVQEKASPDNRYLDGGRAASYEALQAEVTHLKETIAAQDVKLAELARQDAHIAALESPLGQKVEELLAPEGVRAAQL
jgi:ankyrin repeat protein